MAEVMDLKLYAYGYDEKNKQLLEEGGVEYIAEDYVDFVKVDAVMTP